MSTLPKAAMSELTVTKELLDEIEAKAAAANDGVWLTEGALRRGGIGGPADRTHIARMDPPTTFALISLIRELEAENVELARRLDENCIPEIMRSERLHVRRQALEEAAKVTDQYGSSLGGERKGLCDLIGFGIRSLITKGSTLVDTIPPEEWNADHSADNCCAGPLLSKEGT